MPELKKYAVPNFLAEKLSQEVYERWLRHKADAHVRRDRRRGNRAAIGELYRKAIHQAVIRSGGRDAYTGEALDWSLLSKYDNEQSKEYGRRYKHQFALLPTVDHVGDGTDGAEFEICSWRTNDAKHDLTTTDFLKVCRAVLEHHGYIVTASKTDH